MKKEVLKRELFPSGTALFKAGDPSGCAYLIQQGKVEITTEREGETVVLNTLGAGELVGEMALVDAKPRSATAVAKAATTGIVITPLDLRVRLEKADPLLRALVKVLTQKLRKATNG